MYNRIIKYILESPINLLRKRPKNVNSLLAVNGECRVVSVKVCRKELSNKIQWIMNTFTFGQYLKIKNKFNFDKLYHLYLIITLSNGRVFYIEKNERVKIWFKGSSLVKGSNHGECRSFNLLQKPTLNDFICRGEEKGGKNFYLYSAHRNNCQKFCDDILSANGVNQSDFILQNVSQLMTKKYRASFNVITNTAGIGNYMYYGGQN